MNAVEISNVKFCYSQKVILDDINVKVPYGKIYSLLGPSGAGKTTLLRLILGRIKPSSGVITVLQDKPGVKNRLIGYMPQDQALCKTFTVRETLRYFANIFRLSSYEFKSRYRKLLQHSFLGSKLFLYCKNVKYFPEFESSKECSDCRMKAFRYRNFLVVSKKLFRFRSHSCSIQS